MSFSRASLARRGAAHYWKHHLVTFLAVALCSAVLTGALMVGQAMRGTLAKRAAERTGHVVSSLHTGDRFFRQDLAEELKGAPGILLNGSVVSADQKTRIHNVQVLAVSDAYWSFAPNAPDVEQAALAGAPQFPELGDGFGINERLAERLGAKVGDSILLRAANPSALPREAVFSDDEDTTVTLRRKISAIIPAGEFGNFSLQADPLPPYNVFVPLDSELIKAIDRLGQANLILSAEPLITVDPEDGTVTNALAGKMTLADLELELSNKGVLKSKRIFLDPFIERMARDSGVAHQSVLTYFVNELTNDRTKKSVPYSMVTASSVVDVPPGQIVLDDWIADPEDLAAKPGDTIEMTYYTLGEARNLVTKTNSFTVARVIAKTGTPAEDDTLTTEFPGFEGKENCKDWDPNLPVDLDALRDRDEEYWDFYGPSPKAFLHLTDGQDMWQNAYGQLTSIRFEAADADAAEQVGATLALQIDPEEIGFIPRNLAADAGASAKGSVDFSSLFLFMSYFLILAALLLAILQVGFGLDYRSDELELYRTLGLGAAKARGLVLRELLWVIALGALLGGFLGYLYLGLVLRGLNGAWSGVGTQGLLQPSGGEWMMIGVGAVIVTLLMLGAILYSVNKRVKRAGKAVPISPRRRGIIALICCVVFGLGTLGLLLVGSRVPAAMLQGFYFGVGMLAMLFGLALVAVLLQRGSGGNLFGLSLRNLARRPGRTLGVVAMLAAGIYMVFSTGIFKRGDDQAGTGGFALMANMTQPVYRDLNTTKGREALALDEDLLESGDVRFTPLRVSRGEEASCLNLQAAQQPLIVGIDPADFAERFEIIKGEGWAGLDAPAFDNGAFPAIGDLNSLQWAMGYKDVGSEFAVGQGTVRVVGAVNFTVLQGQLLVSNETFKKLFPDQGGYRRFMIDVPADKAEAVSGLFTSTLRDLGAEVVPSSQRLAELNAVQNAYIDIFQTLGGLGVLLGCLGLGILCVRSLLERRRELAVMQAVGFSRSRLTKMLLFEQGGLLLAGLLVGSCAGLLAALPAARAMGVSTVPSRTFYMLIVGAVLGMGSILLAARWFLRAPITENLRAE